MAVTPPWTPMRQGRPSVGIAPAGCQGAMRCAYLAPVSRWAFPPFWHESRPPSLPSRPRLERIALFEKQVALVAARDRIDLLLPAEGSKISDVIR